MWPHPGCRARVWGGQETLEVGEVFDGAELVSARGHVVGDRGELAALSLVPLLLEALIGDPHLDVVGLGGEVP